MSTDSSSGKFVLRMSSEMHQMLRDLASQSGLSLNQLCLNLIERSMSGNLTSHQDQTDQGSIGGSALNLVVGLLREKFKDVLAGVVLFGSQARGEAWTSSDIDLLVILKSNLEVNRDLYREWDLNTQKTKPSLLENVSVHFVTLDLSNKLPGSLWFEVAIDGIVLYDPILEISKYLRQLRYMILSRQIIRKESYGVPYWVPQ